MKISKVLHVVSVIVGMVGVVSFVGAVLGGTDGIVFGVTKLDALLCAGVLILIAIWAQIGAIHHMMLESKGEIV